MGREEENSSGPARGNVKLSLLDGKRFKKIEEDYKKISMSIFFMRRVPFVFLILVLLTGCAGWNKMPRKARWDVLSRQEPSLTENEKILILDHLVVVGMSKYIARLSWGSPFKVNKITTALGTEEQWVYEDSWSGKWKFLYFDTAGKLTCIQD